MKRPTERRSPSTADVQAAIRETRNRLAVQLARTADHVQLLFTAPSYAETEPPVSGLAAHAIKTIAVAGRARRAWTDARRTGLLRRAMIGGVSVAIAAALTTRKRRRSYDRAL